MLCWRCGRNSGDDKNDAHAAHGRTLRIGN
jgi:hypothetical protein